jgi:hypothetical protein
VGARWVTLGGPGRTDATGTFRRTVTAARGTTVRIWALEAGYASPALRVS